MKQMFNMSDHQMRFMKWLQLTGKILDGNKYPWSVMKKSSVSGTRRFTYFQILCYALERWARTFNQIWHGKTDWRGSKRWTDFFVSQWNASGIFSKDSPHCSSATKSKSSCLKWAIHQNLKDGSSSCRCSKTFHWELKTMNRNANWTPTSFLFLQKDLEQDNGHSSDLDQKRSGYSTFDCRPQGEWDRVAELMLLRIWRKRTSNFPSVPGVYCPESRLKAKEVENYQDTSALMGERLKLFVAQLFHLISSVSTEQSQMCVRNTKLAK